MCTWSSCLHHSVEADLGSSVSTLNESRARAAHIVGAAARACAKCAKLNVHSWAQKGWKHGKTTDEDEMCIHARRWEGIQFERFNGLFPCKHALGNKLAHNSGDQRHGPYMTSTIAESKSHTVKAQDELTGKVTWNGRKISKNIADDSL